MMKIMIKVMMIKVLMIFVLNLIGKSNAITREISSPKLPLKIVASDDEVLHPLFEKEEPDTPVVKPEIYCNSRGKKKNISSAEVESLYLKMNLDLPSLSSVNPSVIQKTGNFDSPYGHELIDDVDIVLFRKNVSSNNTVAPGTIIVSSPLNPPKVDSPKVIVPKPVATPLDDNQNPLDSPNFELENKVPCNVDVNDNRNRVSVSPPKRKIRSLDEYSIEGLSFDYTIPGPKINLETNITVDFISNTLIPFFKSGKVLDRKSSYSIFYRAYQEFLDEGTLHDIQIENGQKLIIFGDIHGQFPDFIKVIEKEGPPSNKLKYIFNGDIVDRGAYSIECLLTLLAYKIAEPRNFYVSLGNHETESVGKLQFYKESIKKYGNDEFFKLAHALFKSFPAAYLIQNEIFVTHGGISPFVNLDRIRQIDRLEPEFEDVDIINDLIWSDPVNINGTTSSHRGLGFLFGPDITRDFIYQNNISVIIRSHQYKEFGFSEQHDGLCITIFSCPNYKGKMKNYGAYIKIDDKLNLNYNMFKAAEPNSRTEYPIIPSDLKYNRNIRRIRQ